MSYNILPTHRFEKELKRLVKKIYSKEINGFRFHKKVCNPDCSCVEGGRGWFGWRGGSWGIEREDVFSRWVVFTARIIHISRERW